ncbi:hypothetical protein D3C87_55070 [compost metagenome]
MVMAPLSSAKPITYWWVNQNQTYRDEIHGGFLWSPKTRADGGRNQFYENMKDVSPGDVIFSFCDTKIKAIGLASGAVQTAPKPDFGNAGVNWSKEGWLVPVEFKELAHVIRPKDHIKTLAPHLPEKYSPLQHNGNGLQSVYLAKINHSMAQELINLIGPDYHAALDTLSAEIDLGRASDDAIESAIEGRTDINATTKAQLVNSRRGQGIFKTNVRLNEDACRVTGIKDPLHLCASHIKPWRLSDDREKLHGCNGLLLAPHVDHLFDSGLISFADDGEMLVSYKLQTSVLHAWGISTPKNVGKFNSEQTKFLEFHRTNIFKHKTNNS